MHAQHQLAVKVVGYIKVRDEVGKVASEQKRNCVRLACTWNTRCKLLQYRG